MAKNQLDDFAATLTAQLKDAAEQMRNMRTPPEHPQNEQIDSTTTKKNRSIPKKHKNTIQLVTDTKQLTKKVSNKKEQTQQTSQKQPAKPKDGQIAPTQKEPSINVSISISPEEQSTNSIDQTVLYSHQLSSIDTTDSSQLLQSKNNQQKYSNNLLADPESVDIPSTKLSTTVIDQSSDSHQQTLVDNNNLMAANDSPLSVLPSESLQYTQPSKSMLFETDILQENISHQDIPSPEDNHINTSFIGTPTTSTQPLIDNDSLKQTMTACDTKKQSQSIPWGHFSSDALSTVQINTATIGGARQIVLDALTQLKQEFSHVTINLKRLATVLGLSYGTVRNTISRLVREGVIYTTQIRTGDAHGVYIEFADGSSLLPSVTVTQPTYAQHIPSHQPSTSQQTSTIHTNPIWDVDSDMLSMLWPYAFAAGLKRIHLEHLRKAFQIQQFDDAHVACYLRYLNWKIEKEAQNENQATAILQQWIQTMQQQGKYPRPTDYDEPEGLE